MRVASGWRVALAVAAGLAVFGLHGELLMKVPPRVVLWCAVLFVYAMAGHGELARRRPEPAGLTGYYLAIAAGGALGGLLNAVVAPLLFTGYWELHLGILAGPLVVLMATGLRIPRRPTRTTLLGMTARRASRQLRIAAVLAIVALGGALLWDAARQDRVSCSPPAASTACCASCARSRASRTST